MTFDFAPGWLDGLGSSAEYAAPRPLPAQPPVAAAPRAPAAPCVPAHPSLAQMAALVGELFTEGTLTFEQLCSISNDPDMEALLGDRVAEVPAARRAAAPKRR